MEARVKTYRIATSVAVCQISIPGFTAIQVVMFNKTHAFAYILAPYILAPYILAPYILAPYILAPYILAPCKQMQGSG